MLTFTVYMLLQGLTNKLQVGNLDSCLDIMIEVRFRGRNSKFFFKRSKNTNQFTK